MTDAREQLGRIVRDTWVNWAKEQPDPKPSWLVGWDELDEGQREVDMRVGSAIAAAERARWQRAIIPNIVTLTRPGFGNGPAHDEHVDIVPVSAVADLLDGRP